LNWDHSEVFAVLAVAGVGALWKAASLRADLGKDWTSRVATAEAGLADRATSEALSMQRQITEMIGSGSGKLPRLATVDATPLAGQAGELQKTLQIGARVPRDLKWCLRLGPLMTAAAITFLLGLGAVFLDSSELLTSGPLRIVGLVFEAAALLSGLVLIAAYVILNQRLSGAEIRSQEPPQ
jgi:hypothetical protein